MHATLPRPVAAPPAMRAMAFARPGAAASLQARPVPSPGPNQVLVRLHAAGVGRWDLLRRDGRLFRPRVRTPPASMVAGAEGAGVVVAVGAQVGDISTGMRVYGLSAAGGCQEGCFAEYALFEQEHAWPLPSHLAFDQAAVLPVDGAVALHGLHDLLRAQGDHRLVLFGASGGVGHLALQLARHFGLRTLAIASRSDGMRLVQRLGATCAIDGHEAGVAEAVAGFCAGRPALALFTAGGEVARQVLAALPAGSRAAWPGGVPLALPSAGTAVGGRFNVDYGPASMRALDRLAAQARLLPHVFLRCRLEQLQRALDAVDAHHVGRIAVLSA